MNIPLKIKDLNFKYPSSERWILRNVGFQVHENELVLLLGPSGCGKSTLALAAAGLIPHYVSGQLSGDIAIFGRDTRSIPYKHIVQKVGIMFQDPENSFATLRVDDEVAFALENLGLDRSEIEKRVRNALDFVGLVHKSDMPLQFLSGGEKQRVALAALIAQRPELMVMDEPTSMLDPAATKSFFHLIGRMKNHAILLVEHKLDDLIGLVDKVVVMGRNGDVLAVGKPKQIFDEHFDQIETQGIWMPKVISIARIMQKRSVIEFSKPPLTPEELATSLLESGIFDNLDFEKIEKEIESEEGPRGQELFRLEDVDFVYPNGYKALKEVNLSIFEGETVFIVGRNGAGKTTLIDIMAGLKKPTRGKVILWNTELSKISPDELYKHVGYVFQNPEHQFLQFTVKDELAYTLRIRGFPEDEIEQRVRRMLSHLAMEGYEERNPFMLSQGEKRRLSLGSMLILGQNILILDEPTYGQDRHSASALLRLGADFKGQKATIIVVTHDIDLAFEEADRIVVLDNGRLIWEGPPQHLIKRQDIMETAGLTMPVAAQVSLLLRAHIKNFPILHNLKMWKKLAGNLFNYVGSRAQYETKT